MKTLSIILSFGLLSGATSDQRLFNKLERKIERNPTKGLAYAKKLKQKKSTEPDAYYFLALEDWSKFQKAQTLNKRYMALNRAASNAYYVKKYRKGHQYLFPQSDSIIGSISNGLKAYRDTFLRLEEDHKADRIAFKYHRLTNKQLPTREEIAVEKRQEEQEKLALLQIPRRADGLYYGIPEGTEEIPWHNRKAEQEVIAILNKARIARGLKPLKWNHSLQLSARYHANDMASQNYFSHDTYDRIEGELVKIGGAFKRIRKFYTCCGFANGENIAAGSELAKDTYQQWFTSKGHNAIMFEKSSKWVAVGLAYNPNSSFKYYWVMCTAR